MPRLLLVLVQVCLLSAATLWSKAPAPNVTPEWIQGPEAKALTALPRTVWLKDGTLLLQERGTAAQPVLQRLDPATGAAAPALDQAKALENLRLLLGSKTAPTSLAWLEGPGAFDNLGRKALVKAPVLEGEGYFVLDLATAGFLALPGARAASLSPDGTRVAFVREHDLYILDLAAKAETRLTRDGSDTVLNGLFSWVYWEEVFDHREAAFWWAPDSRTLAFLRSDESAVPLHAFTDFQPFQARLLQQRYPQAGQPNPSVRLGLAAMGTAKVAWLDLAPASFEYLVRVTWLPAGDRLAVQTLNRGQDKLDLDLVDPATGTATRILEERNAAWVHFYEPLFLKDGRHFLWASDRSGYNHVYRYDLQGRLANPVTQGAWSLTPWGMYSGGRTGMAGVDEKGGWVYFTCQASGRLESQVWKARLEGGGLARVSAEPGHHEPSFSPDGRFYLDAWSSVSRPPSLTLRQADGSPVKVLAASHPAPQLSTPALVTLPAADGFPLPASILRPAGFDPARRYPVVFSVYGGPGCPVVQDAWGGWELLYHQLLLAEGYVVVTVDNRSSAAVGLAFETPIKGRLYGDVELQDLVSAVAWVKAQPWADAGRMGVWGWSGGGTYTLAALTRTRDFKAGIAVAPVSDWRFYDSIYTELAMKRPGDNGEGYLATSQVGTARNLHGRLMLIHGSHDDNVHPQNSQAFMEELIQAGTPFDYMVYPMRQHSISDDPARIHLMKTMVEFWRRNL